MEYVDKAQLKDGLKSGHGQSIIEGQFSGHCHLKRDPNIGERVETCLQPRTLAPVEAVPSLVAGIDRARRGLQSLPQ